MTKTKKPLKERSYYKSVVDHLRGRVEITQREVNHIQDGLGRKFMPSNHIMAKILESQGFEREGKYRWVRCRNCQN